MSPLGRYSFYRYTPMDDALPFTALVSDIILTRSQMYVGLIGGIRPGSIWL